MERGHVAKAALNPAGLVQGMGLHHEFTDQVKCQEVEALNCQPRLEHSAAAARLAAWALATGICAIVIDIVTPQQLQSGQRAPGRQPKQHAKCACCRETSTMHCIDP